MIPPMKETFIDAFDIIVEHNIYTTKSPKDPGKNLLVVEIHAKVPEEISNNDEQELTQRLHNLHMVSTAVNEAFQVLNSKIARQIDLFDQPPDEEMPQILQQYPPPQPLLAGLPPPRPKKPKKTKSPQTTKSPHLTKQQAGGVQGICPDETPGTPTRRGPHHTRGAYPTPPPLPGTPPAWGQTVVDVPQYYGAAQHPGRRQWNLPPEHTPVAGQVAPKWAGSPPPCEPGAGTPKQWARPPDPSTPGWRPDWAGGPTQGQIRSPWNKPAPKASGTPGCEPPQWATQAPMETTPQRARGQWGVEPPCAPSQSPPQWATQAPATTMEIPPSRAQWDVEPRCPPSQAQEAPQWATQPRPPPSKTKMARAPREPCVVPQQPKIAYPTLSKPTRSTVEDRPPWRSAGPSGGTFSEPSPDCAGAPAGRPAQRSPSGRPAQGAPAGRPPQRTPSGRPTQSAPSGRPTQSASAGRSTQKPRTTKAAASGSGMTCGPRRFGVPSTRSVPAVPEAPATSTIEDLVGAFDRLEDVANDEVKNSGEQREALNETIKALNSP